MRTEFSAFSLSPAFLNARLALRGLAGTTKLRFALSGSLLLELLLP